MAIFILLGSCRDKSPNPPWLPCCPQTCMFYTFGASGVLIVICNPQEGPDSELGSGERSVFYLLMKMFVTCSHAHLKASTKLLIIKVSAPGSSCLGPGLHGDHCLRRRSLQRTCQTYASCLGSVPSTTGCSPSLI